jgi:uncharacterized BrkB/YihY/UPF0761 family membrane protein
MRSLEEVLEASRRLTPSQVRWSNAFVILCLTFVGLTVFTTYHSGRGWGLIFVGSLLAAILCFIGSLVVRTGRS